MKRKIISLIVACTIILTTNCSVLAVQSSDYKKQAEQAENQKSEAQKQYDELDGQINTALQEVEDINSSIENLENEINDLSDKVKKLNSSISEKEKDLESKQKLLEERLVASYMNGNNTYLSALLTGGLVNFISNYETIKQIAEYDTNLMNEVENTKKELEDEKSEIETAKTEKENKSKDLKKLKSEKQAKVNSLTDEQKQIQAQIDEYDSQMAILKQKELAQAAKEREEAAKNNNSNKGSSNNQNNGNNNSGNNNTSSETGGGSSGKFLWPVPSSHNISSGYGYRIHPISGTKKLHAGIDIAAPGGSNIVAAESGTVILSSYGYNGGYGNYVIISHGNGVTTRYAHCSSLSVSVGDTVTRGQVIAAVGSTGASTGNHCHFEVRINGNSTQPLDYL